MKGGEDINVIDFKWGQAALMLAAVRNDIDSVKLLLQAKNDLSTKTNNGLTAYEYVSDNGFVNLAKILKEAGAQQRI